MDTEFNNNFRLARANWIEHRLSEIPVVKRGTFKGCEVIRAYHLSSSGKRSHQTFFPSSNSFEDMKTLFYERESLISERKSLPRSDISINPVGLIKMNDKLWKTIPSSKNKKEFTSNYRYKGIHMRSRFEVLTAQVIDSIGLEFKYETSITINNITLYPDFLVYIKELGMCIIIECLGMLGDPNYIFTNSKKIQDFITAGYEMNRDIIFLSGNRNSLPDPADIKDLIVLIINYLANRSVTHSPNTLQIDI